MTNSSTSDSESPKQNRQGVDLLNGPIDSTLRIFALPLAFSFIVNMLYSWIDTYFVSKLGSAAIAAIGVSEQLGFMIFNFGSGFAIGTGIIVARRIGEGNREEASYTATQGIMTMLVFSTLLAIVLGLLLPTTLHALGLDKDPQVYGFTEIYLYALLFGVPGNFVTFQINAIIRSSGNSVYPMSILLLTTVINAILAPLLIFGWTFIPAYGMLGAGIATAASQIIGALISLFMIISGRAGLSLKLKGFAFDAPLLLKIIKQGIWSTLQMFSVSISRLALFKFASNFDPKITLAAYTLGLKIDLFAFMSVFAMGIALETATGQNLGARQVDRIKLFYHSAVKQLSVLLGLLAILSYIFGEQFARIYTNDPDIIRETVEYVRIACFGYIFFAIGSVTLRIISGAGAAARSMMVVFTALVIIQIPLAFILSHYTPLHESGIWIGVVLSYIALTVIGYQQYRSGKWLTVQI
ncbi:MAG: MATE family efflux transporter [Bacteroidota bacterium]|nr:MATE family efflux transporter [bacterium]NBP63203.1 MATE family efflux transporter [Bacteroidota bacterium]